MGVPYYGDFPEDAAVYIPFNTFTSDDPSASVTITNLADTDIYYHKNGSDTDYSADAATAVSIDFDGITGNHMLAIDTSENAYFATGSEIAVRMEGTTVDGATINAFIGSFSIERAGGIIALLKLIQAATITNAQGADVATDVAAMIDGSNRVDVGSWLGQAVTLSTANKPDVNIDEISDDTTAPGNLELMYDGTGYAGGTTKQNVNVASEANIDFGAAKKSSLNAATTNLTAITGDKASYKATGFSTHNAAAVKSAIEAGGSTLAQILTDSNEIQGKLPTNKFMGSSDGADDDGNLDSIKAVTDDMKVLDTTISSIDMADTVFRVAAGLTGNVDIDNAVCSIKDVTGGVWSGPRRVTNYVHATLQITIDANTAFTLQASDRVIIWNVSYATTAAAGAISAGDIADIADAVHEETMTDHLTEGTTGAKLNAADRTGR